MCHDFNDYLSFIRPITFYIINYHCVFSGLGNACTVCGSSS